MFINQRLYQICSSGQYSIYLLHSEVEVGYAELYTKISKLFFFGIKEMPGLAPKWSLLKQENRELGAKIPHSLFPVVWIKYQKQLKEEVHSSRHLQG